MAYCSLTNELCLLKGFKWIKQLAEGVLEPLCFNHVEVAFNCESLSDFRLDIDNCVRELNSYFNPLLFYVLIINILDKSAIRVDVEQQRGLNY